MLSDLVILFCASASAVAVVCQVRFVSSANCTGIHCFTSLTLGSVARATLGTPIGRAGQSARLIDGANLIGELHLDCNWSKAIDSQLEWRICQRAELGPILDLLGRCFFRRPTVSSFRVPLVMSLCRLGRLSRRLFEQVQARATHSIISRELVGTFAGQQIMIVAQACAPVEIESNLAAVARGPRVSAR